MFGGVLGGSGLAWSGWSGLVWVVWWGVGGVRCVVGGVWLVAWAWAGVSFVFSALGSRFVVVGFVACPLGFPLRPLGAPLCPGFVLPPLSLLPPPPGVFSLPGPLLPLPLSFVGLLAPSLPFSCPPPGRVACPLCLLFLPFSVAWVAARSVRALRRRRGGSECNLLQTANLKLHGTPKLLPRFVGPYKVTEVINRVAYRLALPESMRRIHNVFHVSLLRAYRSDPVRGLRQPPPPILLDDGSDAYIVERVLDHRERKYGKGSRREYLVRWSGYGPEHNTWEPESHLVLGADVLLAEYWQSQAQAAARVRR